MADRLDLHEFLSGFLVEADEHLLSANRNLLAADGALKSGQVPARQVRDLFRSLHTLKGLAAMVGVEPVVDLSHQMEAVLRAADRKGGRLSARAVDVLLKGIRAIEERVAQLSRGQPVQAAPKPLLESLADLLGEGEGAPPPASRIALEPELLNRLSEGEKAQLAQGVAQQMRVVAIDFRPSPERMAQQITITTVRERLAAVGEIVKVIPRSVPQGPDAPGGLAFAILLLTAHTDDEVARAASLAPGDLRPVAVEPVAEAGGAGGAGEALAEEAQPLPGEDDWQDASAPRRTLVRVDVLRLDDALEKLSALVITRHRMNRALSDLKERGADARELAAILGDQGRQLRELRSAIMTARMVPVREILERVPLMVRGLSRSTGKAVRLQLELGEAELDKAVGDRLFPAIVHLIRNAVDHGLEPAAERQRLGKSVEGTVRVVSHQRGNSQLELRIEDDGRGIDAAAVARSAGVETPKDAEGLLALISRPGLSTRQVADQTSGRGMGMDIVRKIVQDQLSGELELENRPGHGAAFILRVPLSITIIDAFTFAVGEERFAVPVSVVEEILEVEPSRIFEAPAPKRTARTRQLLQRRGEALSLVGLGAVLGMAQEGLELRRALVIRRGGEPIAFGVSRMLGQQEIVVRPLEDPLVRVAGVTGATDLGDGKPTLVLDLAALGDAEHERAVTVTA